MDVLEFSRLQFGDTAAFHILWPIMSIGLALYMVAMEAMWLYTKDESYYRQLRFWTKIFVLTFAIGTASGLPLSVQFGTNWSQFAQAAGDFLGNILGFETTIAFALESAFLAVLIFGWDRVSPKVHFFSTLMVLVGACISAFWIMVANSWMQTPAGMVMVGGKMLITDYRAAIFNPDALVSFAHMLVACVETTIVMIGGIAAWRVLKTDAGPVQEFFRKAFLYSIALSILVAPLQILIGDLSGIKVSAFQPEKLAATELHWTTNPPGTGAAWNILAWPNAAGTGNAFALSIPYALSLVTTHSFTGTVQGLNDFPRPDRPSAAEATIVFYSFRLMMFIGFYLMFLMLVSAWYWWRGELAAARIGAHRLLLKLWVWAIPLGFIATEAGWMTREIGRQPWVVYHVMRTSEGLSTNLNVPEVAATTVLVSAAYVLFGAMFIFFTYRIIRTGPDLSSPVPPLS